MNALLAAAVLVAWQSSVELVKRRAPGISAELLRKLVHVGSGLVAAALPFFVSFRTIAGLGLAFVVAMAVSRRLRLLTAVHDSGRTTYGELFFPLGIALLAAMHASRAAFVYAALVLALADGFAAVVGSRSGRERLGWGKSVAGSSTFFVVSSAIGIAPGARTRVRPTTQFVLDQLDSVVGVVAVLAIFVRDPVVLAATVPLGFTIHVVADRLLYACQVKEPSADAVSPAVVEALA